MLWFLKKDDVINVNDKVLIACNLCFLCVMYAF